MFADIKNQVIVEAGEKREASGSPKEASKAYNKRKAPPKNSKVDRNLVQRDLRVPVLRSSNSTMTNTALLTNESRQ